MPVAGFCSQCGENVYLDANWSCPRGHGWNAVSGWYDTATGAAVAPPWLPQTTAPAAPVATADPVPAPAPAPDPAVTLRRLIRDRLESLNLAITEADGVYSASRGDEYESAVAVDDTNGRILLWERLRAGRDPGVRDAVRALAGSNWAVRIVLRRSDLAG